MVRGPRRRPRRGLPARRQACFARIARHPEAYVIAHGRVRRARLHRFPYGVYYTPRADFIDVLAVYHGRRRPRPFEP